MIKKNSDSSAHKTKRPPSAGRIIQVLARRLNASMSQRLGAHDLRLDQFAILMVLMMEEGLTQTEIGQQAGFAGYTITRALDHLEALGTIERRDDVNSRRTHRIFLTPKGRALLPSLGQIVQSVNAEFLAPLDEKESAAFLLSLTKLLG